MRSIHLLTLCLFLSVVLDQARACSCVTPVLSDRDGAAEQFEVAKAVFAGEVTAIKDLTVSGDAQLTEFTFKIVEPFKGIKESTVELFSDFEHTSCASGIKAGDRLFVYAFEGKEGKLYITPCSRTGSLEEAGTDIRFARGEPAILEDRIPYGEKWRLLDDPTMSEKGATLSGVVRWPQKVAMGKAFVTVWQVDEQNRRLNLIVATQKADSDGTFAVHYLPPGTYFVSGVDSKWEASFRYVGNLGIVSLLEGTKLDHQEIILHADPLGTVNVQVDAPEIPYEKLFVVLRDVELDLETPGSGPYSYGTTANVGSDRVARFKQVPYGRYNVSVMLYGEDISRPTWTHDDAEVTLDNAKAETAVRMYKTNSN